MTLLFPLREPASPQERDQQIMELALRQARNAWQAEEVPVGAIIVRGNQILGRGANGVEALKDATAHAETEAIRDAAKRLGTRDLSDCQMVTNGGRPCPMCETAAYWAQIKKMWLEDGEDVVNAGGPKYGGC